MLQMTEIQLSISAAENRIKIPEITARDYLGDIIGVFLFVLEP